MWCGFSRENIHSFISFMMGLLRLFPPHFWADFKVRKCSDLQGFGFYLLPKYLRALKERKVFQGWTKEKSPIIKKCILYGWTVQKSVSYQDSGKSWVKAKLACYIIIFFYQGTSKCTTSPLCENKLISNKDISTRLLKENIINWLRTKPKAGVVWYNAIQKPSASESRVNGKSWLCSSATHWLGFIKGKYEQHEKASGPLGKGRASENPTDATVPVYHDHSAKHT